MEKSGIRTAGPAISVIIPVYNKGEFFRKTLASVLAQSFADYEIVIVDDGSTDGAGEITRAFNDPRIRYYYQKNSGLPAVARNNGIKYSRGRYIAFLDADDIWHPDKLSRCYDILNNDPEIDLVCHNEAIVSSSGNLIRTTSRGSGRIQNMFRRLLLCGNCLSPSAVIVKKEALLDKGMFREYTNFFSVEDYDLWLRMAKRSVFYFLPEALGEYILHDDNISSQIERHFNNQIVMLRKNFEEYSEKQVLDRLVINARLARMHLSVARSLLCVKDFRQAMSYGGKAFLQLCGIDV